MLKAPRAKSKYLSLVVTLCLATLFFLLLNSIQTKRISRVNGERVEGAGKTPGEYLKHIKPNTTESYCKLNYGIPYHLQFQPDAIQGSPQLGKDSPFRVLYDVIEGTSSADQPGVTYATQLTKDFVWYISEVVRYWDGPISVAAYLPDGDPKWILESMLHFCYCIPEMSRVSLHLVFKKEVSPTFHLRSSLLPPKTCDIQNLAKLTSEPSDNNHSDSNSSSYLDNWYPVNVGRNVARQAAYTEYILVCDVELMPSEGLASRFIDMIETYRCPQPDCGKRVFVVPVFEVESTEEVPRTKTDLVRLISSNKAVYFHQLSCSHCQKFPGLEQWKESDPGTNIKPLMETKRVAPYHRWEPIFIGTKNEPLYLERLSWEGFQDKMLQMLEMCLANYKLVILDGAFLVHWPGIKTAKRKDEPWRLPYVKMNQANYNKALNSLVANYPKNPQCKVQ